MEAYLRKATKQDINKESFATSYQKSNRIIIEPFQEKWEEIKADKYPLVEQKGIGSYHDKKILMN